jgi:hypothetical protein
MKNVLSMAFVAALLLPGTLLAGTCDNDKHPASTPTDRFTMLDDGAVMDKQTGLTWMRCAIGQKWDGKTCVGEAKDYTWPDIGGAKDQLNKTGYAGHSDWRVPLIMELGSIVELQCYNPRVNVTVFPATPSDLFWSSMEKKGTTDLAYTLDFGGGQATAQPKSAEGALRLVRGGPWWTPPQMK